MMVVLMTSHLLQHILLMDEILHHIGALNYCNFEDFRDLRWCKISSINSICDCTKKDLPTILRKGSLLCMQCRSLVAILAHRRN